MNRLFTFGCSFSGWAWPTWADILCFDANKKNFSIVENYGRAGAGNLYIFTRLWEAHAKYNFNENDIVIIQWTSFTREDRYVEGHWVTPGNIFTQNIYNKDFLNRWSDPKHFYYRDYSLIIATQNALKNIGCKTIFLSMTPISQADSNDVNFMYEETKDIEALFAPQIKLDCPSMMEYLNLLDHSPIKAKLRLKTFWGHDKIPNVMPEWHPYPDEHFKYLTNNIIPLLDNYTLEEETKQFANEWAERIYSWPQPINLSGTLWGNGIPWRKMG